MDGDVFAHLLSQQQYIAKCESILYIYIWRPRKKSTVASSEYVTRTILYNIHVSCATKKGKGKKNRKQVRRKRQKRRKANGEKAWAPVTRGTIL